MEIKYTATYRRIKYPRLEFRTGNLELILPRGSNPLHIIDKHKKWIVNKRKLIAQSLAGAENKEISYRTEEEFRNLVKILAAKNASRLKVKINRIRFRKMETKWGSCSSEKNININTKMKYMPEKMVDYVVYHELAHLLVKRHNDEFWKIIVNKYRNYKHLEKSLFSYWFLIKRRFS